ncbi:MAG: cellulase family glycosylhydrolase [Lachnospiraceae bacterium]|nr:cellulase family glycosylhydrolase [Lachnospiraceae bacterium]
MKRKNQLKQLFAGLCAGVLLFTDLPALSLSAAENTQTVSSQMPFRELRADEMVREMGNGWNLGNTMDGHTGFTPSETLWQNVETTQGLMKALHDLGFNTVRVPVTWGTMIDDENNYQIDEAWMSRVQDIVDYCVNMNMYVIINVHHDGAEQAGWLHIAAEDLDPIKEKYAAVWKQIAERFKDYDEHVIFESMNEVTGPGNNVAQDTAIICEFNQIFVDTVRATGSNNAYRWLSVPGRYTNIENTTNPKNGFKLPEDTVENRLFVAVHYYDWSFGLNENDLKTTDFTDQNVAQLGLDFQKLIDTFTSKGIPVILGEYGAINKNNTENRAYHMEVVTRMCQQAGVVPCYWDQGWYDLSLEPDLSFTLIDRETYEQVYPEIISAMMRGLFLSGPGDYSDIERSPVIKEITDLGSYKGTFLLHMGEVERIDLSDRVDKLAFNDVILWKSADETVATVNPDVATDVWAAYVHAAGIGNTVITAYSQSGKAVLEIPVEVRAAVTENSCTGITVEQNAYTMTAGESLYLNAAMEPADTDTFLTYRSSDPSVVTVSKIGKLVAKGKGSAYIIITSSDGMTCVVPVTVEESEISKEISLALNVYFNDSAHNYYSNEYGSAISISEDGQYTLSFDCTQDLSSAAGEAGVTGLNDLTAIYIKDHSVTLGRAQKSPLVSCDIYYDSIKVDGVELEVHMDGPKSAIKASGILDTNDPINSWDGSVIEEVSVSNHVLNFTSVTDPQKVEVTFTISNLVFDEGAEMPEAAEATAIEAAESSVSVSNGAPATIMAQIAPADAGKVAFVSSDASVVSVSNQGIEDANGSVSVKVYAHGTGEAVITAYTTNGLTAEFTVSAEVFEEESIPEGNDPDTSEEQQPEDVTAPEETESTSQNSGIVSTILLILGALVLGAGSFFGALKLAGGKKK